MIPLTHINAMQFQGEDLSETLGFAQLFAGIDGHIATLPEIISARAATPLENLIWNRYYTSVSSEYFGLSRGGNPIVIVAHGNSPLNSIQNIEAAYTPVGDSVKAGYITQEAFRNLENGGYGDVEIVDFAKVRRAYKGSWSEAVTARQATRDPLIKARCGPDWQNVIEKLEMATRQEGGGKGNYILTIESETPYDYWHTSRQDERPRGNLLSTSSTHNMHSRGQVFVSFNVKTHDYTDSMRFAGIRQGGCLTELHRGPELLSSHSEQLLRPYDRQTVLPRLMTLKQFDTGWFSCRSKEGNGMDTGWPEHPVSNMTILGVPGMVAAPYSPFFKYDVAAVIWEAPDEANAYYLGEPQRTTVDDEPVIVAPVHYCHVEVDTTKMCVTKEELDGNFELQMLLLERLS